MPIRSNAAEIRRLRAATGLSCPRFAKLAQVDYSLLWKIENEILDGSSQTQLKIAKALGVAVDAITYFEPTAAARKKQAA